MRLDKPFIDETTTAQTEKSKDNIFSSTISEMFSEAVLIPGLLNFTRDFVWAYFSVECLNLKLRSTDDAGFDQDGQWISQQVYSTLAMFLTLLLMAIFYKIKKPIDEDGMLKKFPWSDGFIYFIAASIATYGWDRMQVIGIKIGQRNLNLSIDSANYFAALLTGTEGFIQYSIIVFLRTFFKAEYYTAMRKDFKKFIKQFFAGMLCSLTLVAPPGANWQIVLTVGMIKKWNAFLTSLAVASTVAFWNYTSVKMSIILLTSIYNYINKNNVRLILNEPDDNSRPNSAHSAFDIAIPIIAQNTTIEAALQSTDLNAIPRVESSGSDLSDTEKNAAKKIPTRRNSLKIAVDYMPTPTEDGKTVETPLTGLARKASSVVAASKWGSLRRAVNSGALKSNHTDETTFGIQ